MIFTRDFRYTHIAQYIECTNDPTLAYIYVSKLLYILSVHVVPIYNICEL